MEPWCPDGGNGAQEGERPSRRLESWKEIAAYVGRDVRTARRWEQTEALPVHRHLHRSRGSVYAFADELEAWHAGRSAPPGAAAERMRLGPGRITFLVTGVSSLVGLTLWVSAIGQDRVKPASRIPDTTATVRGAAASPGRWPTDPEVRHGFILARHHLQRRDGFRREAREYLEAVVQRAPDLAEAHALLGEAFLRQALREPSIRTEAWRKAEASVRRALALDDGLSSAHAVYSRILLLRDWNWRGAADEGLRAITLDPEDADARTAYALYLRSAGRVDQAIQERERAHRADPVNPQWLTFLGDEYAFARRYQDAIRAYERALEIERDYRPAVASLADVFARINRHAEAASWQWRSLTLSGQNDLAVTFEEVRQRDGPDAALRWLEGWNLRQFEGAPDEHLWDLAYLHARRGDRESALRFLQRAYDRHDPGVLQARVDPDLDAVRTDRRFNDLLARVGPH